jgi:hypothetical protein
MGGQLLANRSFAPILPPEFPDIASFFVLHFERNHALQNFRSAWFHVG